MSRRTRRAAVIATAAMIGLGGSGCAAPTPPSPQPDPLAAQTDTASASAPTPQDAPVTVRIPAIGIDSAVVPIGTDATGALAPPETADVIGWYAAGPAPGDQGPALIAAHVDSRAGPGVFFRLRDVHVGDRIDVTRAGGTTVGFTVTRSTRTAKTAFPTDIAYDPTPEPELRIVTCGGRFDRAIHSYRDNILVEAVADATPWTIPG